MTKIAYLRAGKTLNMSPSKPQCYPRPMGPVMAFPPPMRATTAPGPKPLIMTPTTRFNSNPSVLLCDQNNGGRVSKPLMEKRRRARINQCLSQLKLVVVDSAGQHTQNNKCKLEKADILELTVKYVKQLHEQSYRKESDYVNGFSDCIRQVTDYIADIPEVTNEVKHSLNSHLNQCLVNIENKSATASHFLNTPPSPAPSAESAASSDSTSPANSAAKFSEPISPVCFRMSDDDEYEYDDEDLDEEPEMSHHQHQFLQSSQLPLNLKVMNSAPEDEEVWRPW